MAFESFNRDKKSVTIDLSDPEQLKKLRRLIVEKADVFLQNLRPGVVADLGFDPDSLLAENPRLIYCNIGAFGSEGEMARLPGYDPLMQAFTGICHVTGPEDGEPCRVGMPVIDMGTGMWSAMGILSSLLRRKDTGVGGVVDVALYETAMAWMTMPMAAVRATGKAPGRYGTRGPGGLAPNRTFEAADGAMMITAGTDYHFGKLSRALGHPEWADDEKFATSRARSKNETEMSANIGAVIANHPRAYWAEKLNAANIPNAPLHTPVEAYHHPQATVSGILQGGEDGSELQVALPLKLNGKRPPYRRRAPKLGEHNDILN